jgi:Tfp pilus assembly protein PilN
MNEIMIWAGFIRDIGLILGIPVLIGVGVKLYSQQIEILKARNELLKETQYDRAISLLESQKKVFLIERETLDKQIAELDRLVNERDTRLSDIRNAIEQATSKMDSVMQSAIPVNPATAQMIISEHQKRVSDSKD